MQSSIDPESYRLKIAGEPITVSGRYWKTDRVYLNDVCLAVVVEPIAGGMPNDQGAKEELYGMLRGIANLALHHDLMRPLAAFVKNANDPEKVKAWCTDQDWHRGAFTLYVTHSNDPGKGIEKLALTHEELLDPRIRLLSSNQYQERLASDVLDKAYSKLGTCSPELRELFETVRTVIAAMERETDTEKRLKAVKDCLDDWRRDILKQSGTERV